MGAKQTVTRGGDIANDAQSSAPPPGVGVILLFALPVIAFVIEPNLASALLPISAVAVVIGLVRSGRARALVPRGGWALGMPALLVSWAAVALIWTPDGGGDVTRVLKIAGVLLCVAALMVAPLARTARSILLGLALGFAILSPILIEASLNGWFREALTQGRDVWVWFNWEKRPAALLAVFVFPLILGLTRIAPRPVAWGATVLFVGAILVSGYAAAILALVVGAVAAAVGWRLPRVVAGAVVVVLGLLAFAVPAVLPNVALGPFFSSVSASSPQHRVLIADFASARIAERPILGWGLDASRVIPEGASRIVDTPSRSARIDPDLLAAGVREVGQNLPLHPHNAILQVRLELGAIGAGLWIACAALLLWRLARVRDAAARAAGLGQIAAALTVWSVSFGAWQSWWLAVLALSVVAARCARHVGSDARIEVNEKEMGPS